MTDVTEKVVALDRDDFDAVFEGASDIDDGLEATLGLFKALRTEIAYSLNLAGYEWHKVPSELRDLINDIEKLARIARGNADYVYLKLLKHQQEPSDGAAQ